MFLFYVLSFFKKRDTIEGGTLFKGGNYFRKFGSYTCFYCHHCFLSDTRSKKTEKALVFHNQWQCNNR